MTDIVYIKRIKELLDVFCILTTGDRFLWHFIHCYKNISYSCFNSRRVSIHLFLCTFSICALKKKPEWETCDLKRRKHQICVEDEEDVTFLTLTHETNRNVTFPSCSPRGFYIVWALTRSSFNDVIVSCPLLLWWFNGSLMTPPAVCLHQPTPLIFVKHQWMETSINLHFVLQIFWKFGWHLRYI